MTNEKVYKFGLVGCGRISTRHAELLSSGQIHGAKLTAVCDEKIDRARKTGEKYGVPWFTSMDEMMNSELVDVVTVLTPSGMHAEHVIHLSKYKKPIIVEKPMALTLEDADAMIAACEKSGSRLFVVKQNRFNVPVVRLRQELEKNRFGRMVMGTIRVRWSRDQSYYSQDDWRGTWEFDGGAFTNQASHHVDLLQWMMGPVESVFAKSGTYLVSTETEDTGVAMIKFKSGALGMMEATTAVRPKDLEGSITLLGEAGTVEIGGFAVNEIRHWNFVKATADDQMVKEKFSVNPPSVYGYGHKAYLEHVIDVLNNKVDCLVDGREGRKSLELIHAIYESIYSKKEVFYPFKPAHSPLGKKSGAKK